MSSSGRSSGISEARELEGFGAMRIDVRAFASFREILGRELALDLKEGATVQDLLAALAEGNDRFREAAFDSSGEVRDYVLLMKNQKRIDSLQEALKAGDEVAIFPPVAGG